MSRTLHLSSCNPHTSLERPAGYHPHAVPDRQRHGDLGTPRHPRSHSCPGLSPPRRKWYPESGAHHSHTRLPFFTPYAGISNSTQYHLCVLRLSINGIVSCTSFYNLLFSPTLRSVRLIHVRPLDLVYSFPLLCILSWERMLMVALKKKKTKNFYAQPDRPVCGSEIE